MYKLTEAIQGNNPADTAARQITAFVVLGEFISVMTGKTPSSVGTDSTLPGHNEFVAYMKAKDQLTAQSSQLPGTAQTRPIDLERREVLAAFISKPYHVIYWKGINEKAATQRHAGAALATGQPNRVVPAKNTSESKAIQASGDSAQGTTDPSSTFSPADLPSWIKADLAAARGHADLTVFGFEFGQPVNLPTCDNEGGLLGAVASKSGAPRACLGDPVGDMRAAWSPEGIVASLTGVRLAARRSDAIAVTLASNKCPGWLQSRASSCAMQVRLAAGALVSIVVAPGAADGFVQAISEDLTEKYGPPDKRFNTQCISRESGSSTDWSGRTVTVPLPPQTHEAIGLAWSKLPGLHVQYEPFDSAANCSTGVIQVELAGWHKMNVEASARARAARPKM